ncbi:MAG: hypothetical protein NVSMB7_16200 [Chitinophagaceae bacterium]
MYIFLYLPAGAVFAQQKSYSLTELTAAGKNQLPVLLQKQALLNSANASVTELKHSFLPQLKISDQVNLGTDNSLEGSYLPMGTTISTSGGKRATNNYQPVPGNMGVLYGEYNLVNFGLNKALIKNYQAFADVQQSDIDRELYSIQTDIARTYFELQKTQYKLGADEQNVNRYDSIFKVIRALAASGIKPGSDSSLSKAELSKAHITYNQTFGYLNQLKDQLAYLTGIPAGTLQIVNLSNNKDSLPVLNFPEDSLNNPLLDFYVKKTNIFTTNQAVIRKSYLPKILLAAGTWVRGSGIQYNDDYKSLGTGLGYQRFNYMAGIALTYNLFNGLYKKDRLAVNQFQIQASEFELQQQKLDLALAGRQADNALLTNHANLLELPVQLKAAEDTYRQKLAQYKAGIISLIDLTNASFVLYRSQTDYIQAISDWYLAQLDKAQASGNLIKFIQTIK